MRFIKRDLAMVEVLSNRPLADLAIWQLVLNPLPDAMCRMPLLARRLAIGFQHRIHELDGSFQFQRGRSVFFRGFGNALPMASRTIRRCTPSFWATPAIVPTPNSYSRRICSNNSTLALQSNESPPLRASPASEYPFVN